MVMGAVKKAKKKRLVEVGFYRRGHFEIQKDRIPVFVRHDARDKEECRPIPVANTSHLLYIKNSFLHALNRLEGSSDVNADRIKFVVTDDESSGYHTVPDWAIEWMNATNRPIYVSPMNIYLREPLNALIAAKSNKTLSIEERSETLEKISFWESGLLDMEANRRNHEYAALLAMRHGFILSLQTHLLASLP
jgi:hypothetical protein